ncbi:hypothetical protein HDV00_000580 [Rhizophlyctis rosea]|nr:hypothetical protein HDV00_000580 [Rhizophlyctis rosea]
MATAVGRAALIFGLLIAMLHSALALHADQAGLFDWSKQLVGTPQQAYFGVTAKGNSRLFVATDKNVVASLNPATGKPTWRQVLEPNEKILALKNGHAGLFSMSGADGTNGVNLRLWEAQSGFVSWERYIPLDTPLSAAASGFSAVFQPDSIVALVNGKTIVKLSAEDGSLIWTKTQPGKSVYTQIQLVNDKLYAIGTKDLERLSTVTILTLDPISGDTQSTYEPLHSEVVDANIFAVGADHVVWTVRSDTYVHQLGAEKSEVVNAKQFLKPEDQEDDGYVIARQLPVESAGVNTMLLHGAEEHYLWDGGVVDKKLKVVLAGSRPPTGWVVYAAEKLDGRVVVARIKGSAFEKQWTVEIFDVEQRRVLSKHTVEHDFATSGHIVKAYLHFTKSQHARLFIVTSDGSTRVWSEDKVLWTSEESLAHSRAAQFVDLPEKSMLSQVHDELDEKPEESANKNSMARYLRRWSTHILHMQSALGSATTNAATLASRLLPNKSGARNTSEIIMHKDAHGFRKLVIFATATGKVVALDSVYGNVVWARYFAGVEFRQVEVLRTSVMKFPPVVGVIGVIKGQGHKTMIIRLNALTGADQALAESPAVNTVQYFSQIVKLPVEEEEEKSFPLALIDNENKITLLPNTPAARKAFGEVRDGFYFYATEGLGATRLDGFAVGEEVQPGLYSSKPTWSFRLPEGEKVAALPVRQEDEKVASLGRVLGNRSVLYKYLNPNLLALATTKVNGTSHTLYLYLLDTVSGVVHHRGVTYGAGGDVYLVQSENWVVYGYWNHGPAAVEAVVEEEEVGEGSGAGGEGGKKKKRKRRKVVKPDAPDAKGWEVAVLEVFESGKPDERIEGAVFSSWQTKRPYVLSQTYVFPHGVTAVGVTTTGAGITTKEVLFGLDAGYLYGVNKRWLDPRRPTGKPTNDDKEEGLFPYKAGLDFNPKEVASYNIPTKNIAKIISHPTNLESTSLVLAYGLDIFFTRRTPSKQFDVLNEDFLYLGLVGTVVVLLAGIWVAGQLATRKKLKDLWK